MFALKVLTGLMDILAVLHWSWELLKLPHDKVHVGRVGSVNEHRWRRVFGHAGFPNTLVEKPTLWLVRSATRTPSPQPIRGSLKSRPTSPPSAHVFRHSRFLTEVLQAALVLDHPGGNDRVFVVFGYFQVFRAHNHWTGEWESTENDFFKMKALKKRALSSVFHTKFLNLWCNTKMCCFYVFLAI